MSKTPEQMAEEEADRIERQAILCVSLLAMNDGEYFAAKKAYKAGYQAAKDETNLPTSAKWISVNERLPEDRESVIYWHDLHGTNIGHYDSTFPKPNYHWWSYNYGDHADFRVQWWMPLPKIPEAPKGESE